MALVLWLLPTCRIFQNHFLKWCLEPLVCCGIWGIVLVYLVLVLLDSISWEWGFSPFTHNSSQLYSFQQSLCTKQGCPAPTSFLNRALQCPHSLDGILLVWHSAVCSPRLSSAALFCTRSSAGMCLGPHLSIWVFYAFSRAHKDMYVMLDLSHFFLVFSFYIYLLGCLTGAEVMCQNNLVIVSRPFVPFYVWTLISYLDLTKKVIIPDQLES